MGQQAAQLEPPGDLLAPVQADQVVDEHAVIGAEAGVAPRAGATRARVGVGPLGAVGAVMGRTVARELTRDGGRGARQLS